MTDAHATTAARTTHAPNRRGLFAASPADIDPSADAIPPTRRALDHVSSAGNAAGTGARIALLDQRSRREIEQLVRRVEKIETAVEPRFQEFFVEAMAIPHLTAPYERLREAVTLPERTVINTESSARGRRAARRDAGSTAPP